MPDDELTFTAARPGELQAISADLDEQLLRLHQDEDGELRDLSDDGGGRVRPAEPPA